MIDVDHAALDGVWLDLPGCDVWQHDWIADLRAEFRRRNARRQMRRNRRKYVAAVKRRAYRLTEIRIVLYRVDCVGMFYDKAENAVIRPNENLVFCFDDDRSPV